MKLIEASINAPVSKLEIRLTLRRQAMSAMGKLHRNELDSSRRRLWAVTVAQAVPVFLGSRLIKFDPQPDRCQFDHGQVIS